MTDWDLLNENWNSLGDWVKQGVNISEINPAGQLHNHCNSVPASTGRYKTLAGGLPNQYFVRTRIIADNFVTTFGFMEFRFKNATHELKVVIYSDKVKILQVTGFKQKLIDSLEGQWYVWDFVMDSPSNTISVYRDGEFVVETTNAQTNSSGNGLVWTVVGAFEAEMHEDYLKILSGIQIPIKRGKMKTNFSERVLKTSFSERVLKTSFSERVLKTSFSPRVLKTNYSTKILRTE